ncbi:MAG TPA: MFS family transporter [Vitreoscilla sp.]|mgnify:CR=1 FL=1|nr:MFS family transporter [Vitreoscilla sp.]
MEQTQLNSTGARIKAIIGSASGNLVEWYDFYIYSFCALYFAHAFFPKGDQTTELLQAAAVFAVGFFMRPLGSWYFGRLADRVGRKHSMLISVLMMCAGSLVIAFVPTYETIGMAAPIILLLARITQGFSVGGEYGATATYMSEVATSHNRGFLSSFQYVTLIGGQLLASAVVTVLLLVLSKEQMSDWGWRIPFFIGALLAVVSIIMRRNLIETISKKHTENKEAGSMKALWKNPRAMLIVLGITAGSSTIFYTFTTYMQKFLVNTSGFEKDTATFIMTFVLLIFMVAQPVYGMISDKIGRKLCMVLFGGFGVLTTVPLMSSIAQTNNVTIAIVLILLGLAWISFYTSISGIVKADLFPAHVRALGVGLPYAIANAIFGGSSEFLALKLKSVGHEEYFFYYVSVVMAIALIAALAMPDNRKHSLIDKDTHL